MTEWTESHPACHGCDRASFVSDAPKAVPVFSTVMTELLRITPPVTVILTQILTPPYGGVVPSYMLSLWARLFLHAAPKHHQALHILLPYYQIITSYRQDIPIVCSVIPVWRKDAGSQSIHNLYHAWKSSCMFRLFVCSHHQDGYRTLNKKTIKIR
jgi:hypothetical protein